MTGCQELKISLREIPQPPKAIEKPSRIKSAWEEIKKFRKKEPIKPPAIAEAPPLNQ